MKPAYFSAASISRFAIYAAAGLAFWVPGMLVHAVRQRHFGEGALDMLSILFLPAISAIFTLKFVRGRYGAYSRRSTVALWMLFGIWFFGPLCTTVGASFSGGGFTQPHAWMMLLLGIPLFVPLTFMMSTYDGSLGALLFTTLWFLISTVVSYTRAKPATLPNSDNARITVTNPENE